MAAALRPVVERLLEDVAAASQRSWNRSGWSGMTGRVKGLDPTQRQGQGHQRYALTYVPDALLWWPAFLRQKPASGSMP